MLEYRKAYKYVDVSSTKIREEMKESKLKNAENKASEPIIEEKKDFLDDLKRVQADFENYVKRIEKEKEQLKLHAKSELLLKFIDIKEDFERALENSSETNGLGIIYNKIKKILDEEDVKEIEAVGKDFSHVFHEVIKVNDSDGNEIIEEVQKGYLIGDKVLRTSKVILGNGKEGGN